MPERHLRRGAAAALAIACGAIPAAVEAQARTKREKPPNQVVASFYGTGTRTANGERFDPLGMTAAHRTLPFGTLLKVRYGRRAVLVRINDRGPFIRPRSLDLSVGAARAIGMHRRGVVTVRAETPQPKPRPDIPAPPASEPSIAVTQ